MEGIDGGSIIDTWIEKHRLVYVGATRHPFILSIRDGSVDISSLKRWLAQDYVFVRAFVPFVASVLLKSSKESDDPSDVDVILGGMAALNDEIEWFKNEASKWSIGLNSIIPRGANVNYCRFLESLMGSDVDYTKAITALWAIEAVYQESFAHCLEDGSKTPDELKGTCQRWGNEAFGNYCNALRTIVNRRLDKASADLLAQLEVIFLTVLELEVEFWSMSQKAE